MVFSTAVQILSLSKNNMTKYGLKSWRYFATKKHNMLTNGIRSCM